MGKKYKKKFSSFIKIALEPVLRIEIQYRKMVLIKKKFFKIWIFLKHFGRRVLTPPPSLIGDMSPKIWFFYALPWCPHLTSFLPYWSDQLKKIIFVRFPLVWYSVSYLLEGEIRGDKLTICFHFSRDWKDTTGLGSKWGGIIHYIVTSWENRGDFVSESLKNGTVSFILCYSTKITVCL